MTNGQVHSHFYSAARHGPGQVGTNRTPFKCRS